jgi:hypothetical protein
VTDVILKDICLRRLATPNNNAPADRESALNHACRSRCRRSPRNTAAGVGNSSRAHCPAGSAAEVAISFANALRELLERRLKQRIRRYGDTSTCRPASLLGPDRRYCPRSLVILASFRLNRSGTSPAVGLTRSRRWDDLPRQACTSRSSEFEPSLVGSNSPGRQIRPAWIDDPSGVALVLGRTEAYRSNSAEEEGGPACWSDCRARSWTVPFGFGGIPGSPSMLTNPTLTGPVTGGRRGWPFSLPLTDLASVG